MVVLLGLSNELIILIASNVRNRPIYSSLPLSARDYTFIAIHQLYKNVTFDRDDYPPYPAFKSGDTPSMIRCDYTAPQSNILRLSNMIRSRTLPTGQIVTGLTIIIGVNNSCNKFQTLLSLLLPQLSSLKALTLKSISEDRLAWQCEQFSLEAFRVALSNTSHSLESLQMDFYLDDVNDGWTLGSLRHFNKRKYLSVQRGVLLGDYSSSASQMPSLDSVLPLGLKCLQLSCWLTSGIPSLKVILLDLLKDSMKVSRKTERIIVQPNVHLRGLDVLEKDVIRMNRKARRGGLDLRIVLEGTESCGLTPLSTS